MELKKFVTEIVKDWAAITKKEKEEVIEALGGVLSFENGVSGERYALEKLKKINPEYEFVLTDGSKSPADIVCLFKHKEYWHFGLFQVKTSQDTKMLKSEIDEKKTLPILAEIIKKRFLISKETSRYRKKQLFITIGYLGIYKQKKHSVYKSLPYSKSFTLNNLSLTNINKTEIKNKLHRNIK